MAPKSTTNLFLLLINIASLAAFVVPLHNLYLIIVLIFTYTFVRGHNKLKMRIVSIFSILAAFIPHHELSTFFAICALGLALNIGYQIDSDDSSILINSAMAVGILTAYAFPQVLVREHQIDQDIILLTFTLPNLFLSQPCKFSSTKTLYFINPLYDGSWPYSLGYLCGVALSQLFKVPKFVKIFAICFLLLLQTLLYPVPTPVYIILTLLRGLLIHSQEDQDISEFIFLCGYIFMKVFFEERYVVNYMLLGYVVIGVILWYRKPVRRIGNSVSGSGGGDQGQQQSGFRVSLLDRELNQGQN